jgi:pyridoxine kinase
MNLLSIQSHVAYGHVGNASAAFPLQRLGAEVWPVHTVQFSNHTGYGAWRGQVFGADLIRDVVAGIEERGVLPKCDGVLSGYMGDAAIGETILDVVAKVKAANPKARYCCDPVIGDVGRGIFVRPGIPEFMRERALKAADVVAPNQFELDYLAGQETKTLRAALNAIDSVHRAGPQTVLVTSVHLDDTPKDSIDLLASGADGKFRLRTPLLDISVNGAGDAIAALFFFHLLKTGSTVEALSSAASSIFGLMKATKDANSREILLVEAQDEFVKPSHRFAAEKVA